MSMNSRRTIALLLAGCQAIVAVPLHGIYTSPMRFFGATGYWSPMSLLLSVLSVAFVVLPLLALHGVFRDRPHGYWCLSLFPLVALVVGVKAIPFVKHLYGSKVMLNTAFIIMINIGMSGAALWLYRNRARTR
jgi:FlaA1/EpsC-like NDP-sugar epimerase